MLEILTSLQEDMKEVKKNQETVLLLLLEHKQLIAPLGPAYIEECTLDDEGWTQHVEYQVRLLNVLKSCMNNAINRVRGQVLIPVGRLPSMFAAESGVPTALRMALLRFMTAVHLSSAAEVRPCFWSSSHC